MTGAGNTVTFHKPLLVAVHIFGKRKRYRKALKKAGASKHTRRSSVATFHGFDRARKDGQVGQMFLMRDVNENTIIHESVHAGIRVAHEHFGLVLHVDQDDERAHQEEAIAYLAADIASEILCHR